LGGRVHGEVGRSRPGCNQHWLRASANRDHRAAAVLEFPSTAAGARLVSGRSLRCRRWNHQPAMPVFTALLGVCVELRTNRSLPLLARSPIAGYSTGSLSRGIWPSILCQAPLWSRR
jgi:hypothetical protein